MIFQMKLTAKLVLCFVLSLSPVESGSEAEIIRALEETQEEVAWKYIPLSGPSIDKTSLKNITVQLGKTAVINCRVKYLGGKTVSWMRARDLHLLTVGRFTYTSDERFKAVHQTGSNDWLLMIHYAQDRDTGQYECQVSTTPPLSATVWLSVVAEPVTQVLGGPDLYINAGSTINLTCVVSHNNDPPNYIFWYHESEILSYDSPRGGITVVTEHGSSSSSRLLIQRATADDAGQYSCRPANAEAHQINVHIIPTEHPAAIHHKNGTSSGISIHRESLSLYSLVLSIFLIILSLSPNIILLCSNCSYIKGRRKSNYLKCPTKASKPPVGESRDIYLELRERSRSVSLTSGTLNKPCEQTSKSVICYLSPVPTQVNKCKGHITRDKYVREFNHKMVKEEVTEFIISDIEPRPSIKSHINRFLNLYLTFSNSYIDGLHHSSHSIQYFHTSSLLKKAGTEIS